jgi:1,2-dihydroxy-3-keto-5-methylthiopentene dioxygenase
VRVYKEVGQQYPDHLLTILDGFPVDDQSQLETRLEAFKADHGYKVHDVVEITPATPDDALAKFDRPHTHSEDEVRLFLEGSGIFDLRDKDGTWYRFLLEKGDLIVIPAGQVHRFEPTYQKALRCVRVFQDQAGWVPEYVD